MRTVLLLFAFTLFCACGFAQSSNSNVAAIEAKYDADVKAIADSRAAAETKIRQAYLKDLEAAERAATSAGKLQEVAALRKMREAVTNGTPTAAATGLSKAQAKRLADYDAALAALDREFSPRNSRVTTECLRTLATIESSLPSGSPVRQEIETLKTKILSGSAAAGGLSERLRDTKWQWWEDQTVEFRGGGKGVFRGGGGPKDFHWKSTADGKVLYTRDDTPGTIFTLEFTETHMKVTNPQGSSWKGKSLGSAK